MPPYSVSEPAVLPFTLIPAALVISLSLGLAAASVRLGQADRASRRALWALLAAAGWMAATWAIAARGTLRHWDDLPPPFALLVLSIVTLSVWLARGPWGRVLATGLPLWLLVGIQAFRLPLELAMHAMADRGIMPAQMSYSGWNFDILTGLTALVLAVLLRLGWAPRALVRAWNLMGLLLLANVVGIAIASTPAFRAFGDDALNIWVTYPPFVWLPAVMVLAAFVGHLIIWRALSMTTGSTHA